MPTDATDQAHAFSAVDHGGFDIDAAGQDKLDEERQRTAGQ
jgi:hypothetical protein